MMRMLILGACIAVAATWPVSANLDDTSEALTSEEVTERFAALMAPQWEKACNAAIERMAQLQDRLSRLMPSQQAIAGHWIAEFAHRSTTDIASCIALGSLNYVGHGIKPDKGKALALFKKACDLETKSESEQRTGCIAHDNALDHLVGSITNAPRTFMAFEGFVVLSSACEEGNEKGCERFAIAEKSLQSGCEKGSKGDDHRCGILSDLRAE